MVTKFAAKRVKYKRLIDTNYVDAVYPFIIDRDGKGIIYNLSPIHCRSFFVAKNKGGRYIITKGNGLSYSMQDFLYTPEMTSNIWGALYKESALRDFYCGGDIQQLGIKTNLMECVIELDYPLHIPNSNQTINPCLLQYSVECPWRIADACFMTPKQIWDEVLKWDRFNVWNYQEEYLIAAHVLISNLSILHKHGVLHNALTIENLTWALELLDFELCHTPEHPYSKEDYISHITDVIDREILDIYRIIIYIAGVLKQKVDFEMIDRLFAIYGFPIEKYICQAGS